MSQVKVIDFSDLLSLVRELNHPGVPDQRVGGASALELSVIARYRARVDELTREIPQLPGWYAWINADLLNPEAPATNPNYYYYIGETETENRSTSSLNTRLGDYLTKKRAIIWASVYGKEAVLAEHGRRYVYAPNKKQSEMGYPNDLKVHIRRAPITHLIYFGMAGLDREIKPVEANLISYYNPVGNTVHKNTFETTFRNLSAASLPYQKLFLEVSGEFDKAVTDIRATRPAS